jgi:hypothetical protein
MALLSGIVSFKEAPQVASIAVASESPSVSMCITAIGAFALAEIGSNALELAYQKYQWAHETTCFYKRLDHDLQQLMDDAEDYQKLLWFGPCLIDIDSQSVYSEISEIKFNDTLILPSDIKELIFTHLNVEQITIFGQVSKCCYAATKADSIWEYKLNELYGGLKCIPKERCGFNTEQQVKIVYKRTWWLLNKCKLQKQKNYESILRFYNCYTARWDQLRPLVGSDYRGTLESIDPFSKQGRVITCIKQLKMDCQEFSKPDSFKSYLEKAKKALEIYGRLKDFPERVRKMQQLAEADALTGMFITAKINARVWDYGSKIYLCAETFCGKMNEKLGFSGGESQAMKLLYQMLRHKQPLLEPLAPARLYEVLSD